ncbi:hypothetical protein EON66_06485 [archaeon]|nr:MAG: hypothetical protein EON66_06485 [archaeon]
MQTRELHGACETEEVSDAVHLAEGGTEHAAAVKGGPVAVNIHKNPHRRRDALDGNTDDVAYRCECACLSAHSAALRGLLFLEHLLQ